MKPKISLIVPTLNEEKNIKDTLDTIERNVPYLDMDYEIIVVDGGSVDGTIQIVNSMIERNNKLRLLSGEKINGLGDAYKKGVNLAQGDYIIMIPGDNEVSGEAIRTILSYTGQADMIIPYFVNQKIRSKVRQIISKLYVKILNIISGLNLHYYNGTVLHRAAVLKGYNIKTEGFAYQAEILINLIKSGYTYKEIATKIQERSSGKTKIFGWRNIKSIVFSLVNLIWEHRIKVFLGKKLYQKHVSSLNINDFNLKISTPLSLLEVPKDINYIAVFLTFVCNLHCSYCINNFEEKMLKKGIIDGEKWVQGLNRLKLDHNLPVTLQGGEPSLHKDFYYILENLRPDIEIDIMTNLYFDVDEFIRRVKPKRINRDSRFQSIRASYHPETMNIDETIGKVKTLQQAGFNIGLGAVKHPQYEQLINEAAIKSKEAGIVFFAKEFLGFYNGQQYGTYKYPEAVSCQMKKNVQCRTTELLIGPTGEIYKCTRDVYIDNEPIGHILDPEFNVEYKYRYCRHFGYCNPCDIKVKTNRFMKTGHTAVDVKFID